MEFDQVIMDKCEEDTTSPVPFDLDDQVDDEIDEPEYTEIEQEITEEAVPELESPPPSVVTNNQPTCTILSTLKTKELPTMVIHIFEINFIHLKIFNYLFTFFKGYL